MSWASGITANNEGQSASFHIISNSNTELFQVEPTVDANGMLTFEAKPNVSGTAEIMVLLQDDGGTAYGGQNTSATHTFSIDILAVNDPPSFAIGTDIVVSENQGAQTIPGFAHDFDPGPLENNQVAEYLVSTDNPALFLQAPEVSAMASLPLRLEAMCLEWETFRFKSVTMAGTANGGEDTSSVLPFAIVVKAADPLPTPVDPSDLSFTLSGDVALDEDTDAQVVGFASGIGDDVANFQVTNNSESIFRVQPRITPSGTLRFVPKSDAFGSADVTVVASSDSVDSDPQSFRITVNPVNDAPSVSIAGDIQVAQNSGEHQFRGFATGLILGTSTSRRSASSGSF